MENEKIGLSYRPIVFISDLHFDFTNQEFNPEAADRLKEEFLSFIKENY